MRVTVPDYHTFGRAARQIGRNIAVCLCTQMSMVIAHD
jgi:hypothetical protein